MDATNTPPNDTHAAPHAASTATPPSMTVPVRRPVSSSFSSPSASPSDLHPSPTASSSEILSTPAKPPTPRSSQPLSPAPASSSVPNLRPPPSTTLSTDDRGPPLVPISSSEDAFEIPQTTRFQLKFPPLLERWFAPLDDRVIDLVQRRTTGMVLHFSTIFTFFTSIEVSLIAPPTLYALGYDSAAGLCASVLIMLGIISQIPKKFIFRARPWMVKRAVPIRRDKTSSFPSRAVVCGVVFSWLIAQSLAREGGVKDPVNSILLWMAILVVAGCTAFARINVGAHYPSDTLMGFLLGCAVLTVGIRVESMWSSMCNAPLQPYSSHYYHGAILHPANSSLHPSSHGANSFSFPSAAAANASVSLSSSNHLSTPSSSSTSSSSLTHDSVASSPSDAKANDDNGNAKSVASSTSSSTVLSAQGSESLSPGARISRLTSSSRPAMQGTSYSEALYYLIRRLLLRRSFLIVTVVSYIMTLISIQGFWVKCSYVYGLLLSSAAFRASFICFNYSGLSSKSSDSFSRHTSLAHINLHQDIASGVGRHSSLLTHIKAATPFTLLLLFGMATRGKKGAFRVVSFTVIYTGALIAMLAWRLQPDYLKLVDG